MDVVKTVDSILRSLEQDGYYSEIEPEKLKKTLRKYIEREYTRKIKKESNKIEKECLVRGRAATENEYQQAYDRVEVYMLFITHDLAAASFEDLTDLKDFV